MATIADQNDDENKQNPPTTGGAGSAGGNGATSQGGASAPPSNVQQNQAPQNNQGYTDVASYLNANQSGAGQLGSQVSQNLTDKYNSTKQGIDTSYGDFQNQVNSGYVPENTQLIQQVANNPTSAASDSNLSSQFSSQLNDAYGGPTNWADLGTQQGNVAQAQQYGALTNTPGGLNVLTQQVEGQNGGPQSQGINQLDTLLLGGTPGASQQIKSAADPYKGLNDYINQQNMAGQQAVGQAQTNANQTAQDALNAFTGQNGTLTNLNNTINTNATSAQQAAAAQNQQLLADIKNLYGGQTQDNTSSVLGTYGGGTTPWYNMTNYNVGQLAPQDLQALGITQDQWNALQGSLQQAGTSTMALGHNFGAGSPTSQVDLSQWLQQQDPTQAITAANTATPQQYAEMAAIQQLLGSKTPQGGAINPLNASQAGTAPKATNTFDYNAALSGTQGLAANERQAAQDAANQISGAADLAHAQSQHHGGLLGYIPNGISTALKDLFPVGYIANSGAYNAGKQLSGKAGLAHGGEIDEYLDKSKEGK